MVRAVVIAQVAVELGQGYYLGRSEQERLEKGRLQPEKHACKWHKQVELLRTCPQWQRGEGEMMGRRNMAADGPPDLETSGTWAWSNVGRPNGSRIFSLHLCRCCCHRNNKYRRKRQVFAAGETFREWIPNLIEVKLSPQKGEILIADKLITWKYF